MAIRMVITALLVVSVLAPSAASGLQATLSAHQREILSNDMAVASKALDESINAKNLEDLLVGLNHPHPLVQWAAARALGDLGDKSAVPALVLRLEQPEMYVQGGSDSMAITEEARTAFVVALEKLTELKLSPNRPVTFDEVPQIIDTCKAWIATDQARTPRPPN